MNPQDNAVTLLTDEHRAVRDLFQAYEVLGDEADADTNNRKKQLADQICSALTVHAMIEEEIFYPAVRAAAPDSESLMDEAVVEHASAKELIAQLQEMDPEDDLYDAKVKVLSEQIDHHVKEEEQEMFPRAEAAGVDLAALAQELSLRRDEIVATI